MCPSPYLSPYVCLCWDCRPIWYGLRPTASPSAATVEPPYCHTRNTLTGRQGAAHSDAAGNVPLAVAARVGAAEEVKQVLEARHRENHRFMYFIAAGAGEEEVIQAVRDQPEAPTPSFLTAKPVHWK